MGLKSKGNPLKVVFLDRDGVINEFPGNGNYVTRVKNFHFIPGALEAISRLTASGFTLFIVSNQAGVGKGIYSRDKLNRITKKMMTAVQKTGGRIRKVFYCIHRTDWGCDCRKPQIGSLVRAMKVINKSMHHIEHAFFVGDTKIDIQAGHNAGCKTIFVLSGRDQRRDIKKWPVQPDYIVKNLLAATEIIDHENSSHSRLRGGRASKSR